VLAVAVVIAAEVSIRVVPGQERERAGGQRGERRGGEAEAKVRARVGHGGPDGATGRAIPPEGAEGRTCNSISAPSYQPFERPDMEAPDETEETGLR
jgi:hypothetical protein